MKSMKSALFLLAVLCFFASCKNAAPSAEAEAKKICECGQSFTTVSEKMAAASAEEKQSMMAEYTKATNEAIACVKTNMASKMATLKGDELTQFQTKLDAAVKAECPQLSSVLGK